MRKGFQGIKPGWCRVGFHYAMDDAEADYVIDAVLFVARHGHRFLPLYEFDSATGLWSHRTHVEQHDAVLDRGCAGVQRLRAAADAAGDAAQLYATSLAEAAAWAARLGEPGPRR